MIFLLRSDGRLTGLISPSKVWGETETVRDCLNPIFPGSPNSFPLDVQQSIPGIYKLQPLVIELWDEDGKVRSKTDDPLGRAVLGWKHLWPPTDHPSAIGEKLTVQLTGKGAKKGSTVTFAVKVPAVAVATTSSSTPPPWSMRILLAMLSLSAFLIFLLLIISSFLVQLVP